MTQNLTKDVKDTDASASELQTLTLDAVALLVHILEEAQRGNLTTKTVIEGAGVSLSLQGNASAHMTCNGERGY